MGHGHGLGTRAVPCGEGLQETDHRVQLSGCDQVVLHAAQRRRQDRGRDGLPGSADRRGDRRVPARGETGKPRPDDRGEGAGGQGLLVVPRPAQVRERPAFRLRPGLRAPHHAHHGRGEHQGHDPLPEVPGPRRVLMSRARGARSCLAGLVTTLLLLLLLLRPPLLSAFRSPSGARLRASRTRDMANASAHLECASSCLFCPGRLIGIPTCIISGLLLPCSMSQIAMRCQQHVDIYVDYLRCRTTRWHGTRRSTHPYTAKADRACTRAIFDLLFSCVEHSLCVKYFLRVEHHLRVARRRRCCVSGKAETGVHGRVN
mmetsp:Transcript_2567/g.6413  ORF Transcript_2567/g.6413 Transcript_2567/m.6413 type:complete len:316 (-) Transcript_2567:8-955(-)